MGDENSTVIITGANSGAVCPRLEIWDFIKDIKYFSLYIQALIRMQTDDQTRTTSHFQVGGIHGRPYVQWNGAGGAKSINSPPASEPIYSALASEPVYPDRQPTSADDAPWDGYCVHGSVLFPTWHRPYLALYEQIIHGYAIEIADTYTTPDKDAWRQAARTLRLPYWDWIREETKGVPPEEILYNAEVSIIKPDGTSGPIKNPFLSYTFHPIEKTFQKNFLTWPTTLRCPNSAYPDATSTPDEVVTNITKTYDQRLEAVFGLLIGVNDWIHMSNHTEPKIKIDAEYVPSLESIHDCMHLSVGGRTTGGHMSDQDYAGHDPIFYLHHANVDRILAMWQVFHRESWVVQSSAHDGGTWTQKSDETINSATALTPFWNSTSGFWSSDTVRHSESLYYTYPILVGLDSSNPESASTELADRFRLEHLRLGILPPPWLDTPVNSQVAVNTTETLHDWRVLIKSAKYALRGSYSIFIFVGEVPDDPRDWISSPSFVGVHDIFSRQAPEQCANCSRNPDRVVEGVVFLGPALRGSGKSTMKSDEMTLYLKKNLHWRVLKPGQGALPTAQLESLEVSVVSVPVGLERIPGQAGGATRHPEITRGRQGGADNVE